MVMAAFFAGTSAAQVTSEPAAASTTPQLAPHQHGPMKFHRIREDNTSESYNWSGYAATGAADSFTKVVGSWIVPAVNCTATPNAYSSFWVGIDGYNSGTVEQTGTDSDCSSGTPQYYAWYEFYPQNAYYACPPSSGRNRNPQPCPLQNLHVGDVMQASVAYTAGGRNGTFTATITDLTTGATFSTTYQPFRADQRSSVEWIAEAPCCTSSGGILPLSDFGTVSLGFDYTKVSGTNDASVNSGTPAPISVFGNGLQQINMVGATSPNPLEATTSALSADGTSFTVTWVSQ
jgi:hypothetical protein